jgi:hypothetical protein
VLGLETASLDQRFRNDESLRRFGAANFAARDVTVSGFASGGMVGGAGAGDKVPALLTSGEFVLNQRAVARAGPHNVQRFNDGGPVGAVAGPAGAPGSGSGPTVPGEDAVRAMAQLAGALGQFGSAAGAFGTAAQALAQTFAGFAGQAQALTQALNNMPRSLNGQFQHSVQVIHNGAEVFAKMTPAIEQMVAERVTSALNRVFKEHLPDAGIRVS